MSSFTVPISSTQLEARLWRLDKSFRYYAGENRSGYYFDVEAGFLFDGGSIPRFAWWVDAPNGDGAQAYCLHDVLYKSHLVPRREADRLLEEGLAVKGLNGFRRFMIYRPVRAFGWLAYNAKTAEQQLEGRKYVGVSGERPL